MIGDVFGFTRVGRSVTAAWRLFGWFAAYEPITIAEPRVAIGVGKAFDPVFVSLAFFGIAGGTVLSFLTILVVPFEAAEETVFGTVGPYCRVDEVGC